MKEELAPKDHAAPVERKNAIGRRNFVKVAVTAAAEALGISSHTVSFHLRNVDGNFTAALTR
jgi:hypothetical protein